MNLIELKAQAFDTLATIQKLQRDLDQLNQMIINYKEPVKEVKAEPVKE